MARGSALRRAACLLARSGQQGRSGAAEGLEKLKIFDISASASSRLLSTGSCGRSVLGGFCWVGWVGVGRSPPGDRCTFC